MKSLLPHGCRLALALAAAGTVNAALITYDGSSAPDSATFGPTFTTIVFAHASWGSDGNVLTMNTAVGEGIWFGAGYSYNDNPAWNLGDNTVGNGLTLRAKVSADGTDWNAYIADGSKYAAFNFNSTSVQYQTPTELVTYPLDGTQFHTYAFLLRGGDVIYKVDDITLYSGPSSTSSGYIGLIGDGSGSTISGTGTFHLDYAIFDNAPSASVPEPAGFAMLTLAACAGFAGWRRLGLKRN